MDAPRRLVRSVLTWPVRSQQGSRRNALVASTALTQRRRERDEVEEFLAGRALAARPPARQDEARHGVI
jgi:hypothetical protein